MTCKWEGTKQSQQSEERHGARSGGNQAQTPRAFSQWSHRDTLHSLSHKSHHDNAWKVVSAREALWRRSPSGSYRGWSRSSAQHAPKAQTPRRKAAVQHKPCCLCEQFRVSHSHQGMVGTLLKSKFAEDSPWPAL